MTTLEPLAISPSFDGTVSVPSTAIAQRADIIATALAVTSVSNQTELEQAVHALRDIAACVKATEDTRKSVKQPFLAFGKKIDETAADFISPVEKEKARVTLLVNAYQRAELEKQQAEARRLADEHRKAEADRWKAEAEIKRQQEELDRKKRELENAELTKKQRAETERQQKEAAAKLLAAQLAAEEAAMDKASVETQLAAPTTSTRGLATKVRWDFKIIDPAKCYESLREFWESKEENEILRFKRAEFLRTLNAEGSGNVSPFLPPEGVNEVSNPRVGIRVFRDVNAHVR